MAAPLLGRGVSLILSRRLRHNTTLPPAAAAAASSAGRLFAARRPCYTTTTTTSTTTTATTTASPNDSSFENNLAKGPSCNLNHPRWADDPDYRKWRQKEKEILDDVDPITNLMKYILHSERYVDGECLTADDEKAVVEKVLAYHPHSEDKIGCGLDYIMVDRHPQFKGSRCLFVVRTDGVWIDFSYQKCIRQYIRQKYPKPYAEKFIRKHYKRGSS